MMLFKRVAILSALLTALLIGLAAYRYPGVKISLSILGGSGIGLANFYLLARVVTGLLARESTEKGRVAALFFLKLLALAAFFGILFALPINMIAFLAGFATVMLAILIAGLYGRTL